MRKLSENLVGKTVLVTGATGFLAGHIIAQLMQQGANVVGTVRKQEGIVRVANTMATVAGTDQGGFSGVVTDLSVDQGWREAMQGVDMVIHSASPFVAYYPKDENELIKPAVDGTLRVLRAAKDAGIRRVVLTSSIASIVYNYPQKPFNENHWSDPNSDFVTPYYKSKTLAEQAAWQFAKEHSLELSVVNPGAIFGPALEKDFGTSLELIRRLLLGKMPGLPKLGFSLVDVRDCADLHIRALTNEAAIGQRYIAAGEFMWMRDIANSLRTSFPERAQTIPTRSVPSWLVRLNALFDSGMKTLTKDLDKELPLTNAKAKRELGWQPRSDAEAIKAGGQSLIDLGIVV